MQTGQDNLLEQRSSPGVVRDALEALYASQILVAAAEQQYLAAPSASAPDMSVQSAPTVPNSNPEAPNLEWEAKTAAAILDLVGKIHESPDLNHACHSLAADLRDYIGCDRVAIGIRRNENACCRLIAISGVIESDPRADVMRSMEAVLDECVHRDTIRAWSLTNEADQEAAHCERTLASLTNTRAVLSVPLRTPSGSGIGAWVFLGPDSFIDHSLNLRFLETCAPNVAGGLHMLQQSQPGRVRSFLRRLLKAMPLLRGKTVWVLAAAAAAAMFIPMPYNVSVECELQPVVRRFVAAPFAGEFEKSLAKPGDLVTKGQVLGRMSGRELRWELAGLVADQQRACKSRDANMASAKTAVAQMDQLEIERLELKRALLENRLKQLEIRSPINGIVISGDVERSEGVPVEIGQVLFEVAPLDSMLVELAIPDNEISHINAGMPTTVRLDAHSGSLWSGSLKRIQPRSVTRETDNVFLGELPLDNADRVLKPGMKGRGKIRTASHSLGWILFHKPWDHAMTWLGW